MQLRKQQEVLLSRAQRQSLRVHHSQKNTLDHQQQRNTPEGLVCFPKRKYSHIGYRFIDCDPHTEVIGLVLNRCLVVCENSKLEQNRTCRITPEFLRDLALVIFTFFLKSLYLMYHCRILWVFDCFVSAPLWCSLWSLEHLNCMSPLFFWSFRFLFELYSILNVVSCLSEGFLHMLLGKVLERLNELLLHFCGFFNCENIPFIILYSWSARHDWKRYILIVLSCDWNTAHINLSFPTLRFGTFVSVSLHFSSLNNENYLQWPLSVAIFLLPAVKYKSLNWS